MAIIQADVDIMNMALRRIGAEPISLSEATTPVSKASKVVTAFYEGTVREVLRIMPWNCAVKRASIAGVSDSSTNYTKKFDLTSLTPYPQWTPLTAYTAGQLVANSSGKLYGCTVGGTSASSGGPTTSVADGIITDGSVHWVYLGTYANDLVRTLELNGDPNIPYRVEGTSLFCNETSPVMLRYIARPAMSSSLDSVLIETIVARLASKICYVITGQGDIAQLLYQEFTLDLAVGKQISAVEDRGDIIDLFGLYQNAQLAIRSNTVQG
jgi:hypothetical protein